MLMQNHIYSYSINVGEYRRGHQKWQSRETDNSGYRRRRQTKQKHNTICVGNHYTQINVNTVNKTRALLQTNGGGKDEPNIGNLFIFKEVEF